jgi:hypothetical protein
MATLEIIDEETCYRIYRKLDEVQAYIQQLEHEVSRLQADAEWRPFKTAPMDGTEILAWREHSDFCFVQCKKNDIGNPEVIVWVGQSDGRVRFPPTHWRPLPARPEVKS